MTSVSGHLLTYAFSGIHKAWQACDPITLFDAEVKKICPEDYQKIKVISVFKFKYVFLIVINVYRKLFRKNCVIVKH